MNFITFVSLCFHAALMLVHAERAQVGAPLALQARLLVRSSPHFHVRICELVISLLSMLFSLIFFEWLSSIHFSVALFKHT
jgi:hypothetical protein